MHMVVNELAEVLLSNRFSEVSAMDVYSDIFRLGEGRIQRSGEPGGSFKTNPIIYMKNQEDEKGRYRVMLEDKFEELLAEAAEYDFAILNGMTYFGRKSTIKNASKCYALILDIDGQTEDTLQLFLAWARTEHYRIPIPNYIILSGYNIHAYWLFDEPVNLYPETKRQLKEFKYALINKVWNPDTSILKEKQFQGINQGFRPVSGKTKRKGVRVRAFKAPNQPKWSIEEMNKYVAPESRVDPQIRYAQSKCTIQEAKERWPEWYERRIENQEKAGDWAVSRNLYEWWKGQIMSGATFHHRYFCILCLASIAMRCSHYDAKKNPNPVTFEELERDARALKPFLNSIKEDAPFTDDDIRSALEGFDPDMQRMRIETVTKMSAIEIQRNTRRKGDKQGVHLAIARAAQQIRDPEGGWRNKEGAPTKENEVKAYAAEHPEANHSEIARALGVSRPTVIKWLK